jgi:ABC-type molybdate transport system ATPase subunit
VGKTCAVDYYGSAVRAVHIEGMPSMTVSYIRDLLAHELGVQGGTKFAQQQAIQRTLKQQGLPLILDEAQHGLDKKADVIEYLRRVAEQAGSMLILVCHSSERSRFGEHRLAHIATRISAVVEFQAASFEDCALYLNELCEVTVDARIIEQAHQQSSGRYRLLTSACATLEHIAQVKGVTALTYQDTKDFLLCQNVMQTLKKGV